MDPDVTLRLIRANADTYVANHPEEATRESLVDLVESLVGHIKNLDDWMSRGGHAPSDWKPRTR